jgi:DNA-binding beta-propeller fold protein YncE
LSLTAAPGPYPWRLVDTIPVGYGQVSGAVSPDGRYLYAASTIDRCVYVIRTSDDSVVLRLDMLDRTSWSNSRDVVASPDGEYLYASWYSAYCDKIAVIRTSDFSVVDSVDVGDDLSGMSISPDGDWLAAGGYAGDYYVMYVVSTQTRTADTVTLPEDVGRVATVASPDGSCFYACGMFYDRVAVVSTADWTVTDTIEFSAGYFPLLSPDGKYFYSAATEDTEVVAFSIPKERVEWSVRLPYYGYPSAISADGEYIYGIMTEGGLEGVSWFFVVRVSDQTLVHTVELPCEVDASRIVLAPSGDRAYVPGDSRIYVVAR